MKRAKKTTESQQSNSNPGEPEQECSTGTGEIEAPEELDAIETEIIEQEEPPESHDFSGGDYTTGKFLGTDACSGLCSMVFDVLASRRGDHWRLQAPEAEQLGGALDQVLAKYLPDNMERWGPEITLITVATMIVLPRMRGEDGEA